VAWIPDVVSHTTIRSAGWGNLIRDKVVHVVSSKAERDQNVVPVEGMRCYTADTAITYVRVAGAWYVESMPPKPYAPAAWGSPAGPGAVAPIGVPSGSGLWWQSMGICHTRAAYQVHMGPYVDMNAWLYVNTPVTVASAGPTGPVRAVFNSNGQTVGGWSIWFDNNTGGAQGSRCIVGQVGVGPSNAVIAVPAAAPLVSVDLTMEFPCSPTVDG
jgi:hypothetical protein